MERRLILAITFSLLILWSWSALVSKVYHVDNKEVTKTNLPSQTITQPQIPAQPPATSLELKIPPPSFVKFSQEKFDILFIEPQAAIKEIIFKDYHSAKFNLGQGFLLQDGQYIFKKEDSASDKQITFAYSNKDKRIIKRFYFPNSNYNIRLELEVQNLSPTLIEINLPVILGVLNFAGDQAEARFQDVTLASKDKTLHLNARKEVTSEGVQFVGLRNRYFCAIIEPESGNYVGFIKKINPQESEIGLVSKFRLSPEEKIQHTFNIYLGPQDLKQITNIKPEWTAVVYYGSFDFIAHLLLQLLDLLYRLVHNWGWVIIILSILIYLLLYPLTIKQLRSAKQMQALQPRIEELRKTYKNNSQKLNTEIMKLYREYKVNPFSGCLPLILQIPVFFALYQVFMRSVALKGAKFLWIKDLSEPDKLFTLPTKLPIIGDELNILPILMTIGMFIQQKKSMSTSGSASAEQQKLMLIMFPLMFGFIFYHMPSGLVLYWFINSTLMLLYQMRLSTAK